MTPGAWLSALAVASLEGGVLLLLIWAVTRLWPHMPAAARCGLWWLGSLRMIYGLLPLPPLPVSLTAGWIPPPAVLPSPIVEWGQAVASTVATPAATVASRPPLDPIAAGLALVWLVGLVIGVALMSRRLVSLRRTWRAAQPFADPRVLRWQDEWAVALGRARVPEIRTSADTRVPVAIGGWRPGLLLPADAGSLSDDALRMVFAHELSHVRRHDPLLAWVPVVAQLVFWFHPLVRFAGREYLAAREQVCDADALRATGVAPGDYGSLLLAFGVGRMSDLPGAASCGSPASRDLKRRLDMLSRNPVVPTVHRVGAAALMLAIVTLAFVPVRLVVAHESEYKTSRQEPRKRSPIAYLIKTKGKEGTRGSVDMADLKSARKLDRVDETAVYVRLGERMWITRDEETIAEVLGALDEEDRFEEGRKVNEERRAALEREQMKLERQNEVLEALKSEIESRKRTLEERLERRRDAGQSTRELAIEAAEIQQQMEELWSRAAKLSFEHQILHDQMKEAHGDDMEAHAQLERIHRRTLDSISDIVRRAIEAGRAEAFTP